jgi:hypothetical protein
MYILSFIEPTNIVQKTDELGKPWHKLCRRPHFGWKITPNHKAGSMSRERISRRWS